MTLLERINQPQDLKKLTMEELNRLTAEIRRELIDTVACTGGHLAPNLGVVELTLALHLTFDSPRDQMVWDVGHQTYVHKLITGRREDFCTLRQQSGLSGFPKRRESEHDIFETGHSSTSISAALGLALARDLKKQDYNVIAIIGDGALTGGEAFEALNHAGHLQTRMVVVLNDNEMSIANNVGALAGYLTRLRTEPVYFRSKEEVEHILKRIPRIGSKVLHAVDKVKDAVKYLVIPGILFEELGFTYLGPVDGHNISSLRTVLQHARQMTGPTLVHVVTKKGKGYPPAEQNSDLFHGIGPFAVETGKAHRLSDIPSYTQVFGEALTELAEKDERIVAITAAMPLGTGLSGFASRFPQRFFDVGIAEQHAATMAAAMAQGGFRPVLAIYSTFLQRAYDQVLHDICLQNLPVTLAVDRAGLVGEDGATHQGVFDISYLRHIPNLTIMAPRDEEQLRHCLITALNLDGPAAVRYPRGSGQGVKREDKMQKLVVPSSELLETGEDLLLIGIGPITNTCREASKKMRQRGIQAAVLDLRFVKPLDEPGIMAALGKNRRVVIVEEHVKAGGAGSALLEMFNHRGADLEALSLGLPDEFIEHGTPEQLREEYRLTADGIIEAVAERWYKTLKTVKSPRINIKSV